MITNILSIILLITFFIQSLLCLRFLTTVFKIKGGITTMIVLSAINAYANLSVGLFFSANSTTTYAFILLLYVVQALIFFDADNVTKVTFGLITPLHLIAYSFIFGAILAVVGGFSFYEIFSTPNKFLIVRIATAILLSISALIYQQLGTKFCNLLKKYPERMRVLFMAEILILIQLIATSTIFLISQAHIYLVFVVMLVGVGASGIFYIGVYMLVGFEDDYRIYSHSRLLENMYRNMLIEKSERTIEIDCTTGKILNYIVGGEVDKSFIGTSYTTLIHNVMENKIHPDDKDLFMEQHKVSHMSTVCSDVDKYAYESEFRLKGDDEEYTWYKDFINVQKEANDNIKAVLVSNNIQLNKNLEFCANMDGLSGLYNKKATSELIEDYIINSKSGILFMIDIDNFKGINDNFGHDVGDEVIRDIATKLSCIFKKSDILGRIGGDEFMVFVKSPEPVNIEDKALQICEAIYTTYYNDAGSVTISSSIGICSVTEAITNFQDLYKVADNALYESKSRGKNTFTIHYT
ncbi:MAG: hypothetical protein BEN18_06650 [Epulopiscium sp. Nuni2H_MBin001]|nr:MAG: hypothetical protein BEN18_06650 [Epulopiscium sp. Nuni2H_MBin001]